jgi:hypothetical protein
METRLRSLSSQFVLRVWRALDMLQTHLYEAPTVVTFIGTERKVVVTRWQERGKWRVSV